MTRETPTESTTDTTEGEDYELRTVQLELTATMGVPVYPDDTLEEAFNRETAEQMSDARLRDKFYNGNLSFTELPPEVESETTVEQCGDFTEIQGEDIADGSIAIDRSDDVEENPRVIVHVESSDRIETVHDEGCYKVVALEPTDPFERPSDPDEQDEQNRPVDQDNVDGRKDE